MLKDLILMGFVQKCCAMSGNGATPPVVSIFTISSPYNHHQHRLYYIEVQGIVGGGGGGGSGG